MVCNSLWLAQVPEYGHDDILDNSKSVRQLAHTSRRVAKHWTLLNLVPKVVE